MEIGDKDPSFIGSREWIGAIELSFVLDKLLGVSMQAPQVLTLITDIGGFQFPFVYNFASVLRIF